MAKRLPKDAFNLTPRLNVLGKGKEDKEDKTLIPNPDAMEQDVELSKKLVMSLPLDIRTKRDLAIDYMNPEETLAAYVQTVDQNPPFDWSTLTMIAPSDDIARQSISLIQSGRANFLKEENKFNASWNENQVPLPPGVPSKDDLATIIEKNIEMQRQEALDQTSSL